MAKLCFNFVLGALLAISSTVAMTMVESPFPAACPRCPYLEAMPFKATTMANGNVCITLRCPTCGHEWELEITSARVTLALKPDRRNHLTRS